MNRFSILAPVFLALVLLSVLPRSARAQQASISPHGEIQSGIGCNSCHRTEGWRPVKANLDFQHNMQTDFPLTGSHTRVACASCHIDLKFSEPHATTTDCATCHLDVHQGVLSENCTGCHNTTFFQDVEGIALHAQTSFPLTGTHAQLTCISCHTNDTNGAFSPLDTDCFSCHEDDYDDTRRFDHVAAGFPTECETCHNDLQWQGAVFDHRIASNGFDLIGAHDRLQCESCHRSPNLTPIFTVTNDQQCIECHQSDYDDQHAGTGFPTTCLECHGQETWNDAVFDHTVASNGFNLLGAHEQMQCESCHSLPDMGMLFQPPPASDQDCFTCHQPDYDANHAGSGFPTTCLECHSTDTWQASDFDHLVASNGFDLLGAHDALQCESCHSMPDLGMLFQPPPASDQDCVTCHQPDYDANHAGTGFPTTCLECHNNTLWSDVTFDHITSSGGFDLLGAHDQIACTSCHNLPDYSLTYQPPPASDQDCVTCHQPDYDANHAGSGFSTLCLDCHTTDSWQGADFDHDALYFPIYSGKHRGKWQNDCQTCHLQPNNYSYFSCEGSCHRHTQANMDPKHSQIKDYAFDFPLCLNCHPDGN